MRVSLDPYLHLLKQILTGSLFEEDTIWARDGHGRYVRHAPYDHRRRTLGLDVPRRGLTMVGWKRLESLEDCVAVIRDEGIPGDFLETGVWRGGVGIFLKAVLRQYGLEDRTVWLADLFGGPVRLNALLKLFGRAASYFAWLAPERFTRFVLKRGVFPVPEVIEGDLMNFIIFLSRYPELVEELTEMTSMAAIEENARRFGLFDERLRFLPGLVHESMPAAPIENLALLRLDVDYYEATLAVLTHAYERVSPGGFVVVDDYGSLDGCRRAVDDFRDRSEITTEMHWIDEHAVFWRRPG